MLNPITLAILLSFMLAPLADLLRRIHLGSVLSALLAVLIALGVVLALGGLIGSQIADLANDVPRYETTVHQKLNTLRALTVERLTAVMRNVGHETAQPNARPHQTRRPRRPHRKTKSRRQFQWRCGKRRQRPWS